MNEMRLVEEIERALTRFMADHGVDRTEAIRQILHKWFDENGYLAPSTDRLVATAEIVIASELSENLGIKGAVLP